jgi:hypothetical protein
LAVAFAIRLWTDFEKRKNTNKKRNQDISIAFVSSSSLHQPPVNVMTTSGYSSFRLYTLSAAY